MAYGLLKKKTREDYLLEHLGLTKNYELMSPSSGPNGTRGKKEGGRKPTQQESGTSLRAASQSMMRTNSAPSGLSKLHGTSPCASPKARPSTSASKLPNTLAVASQLRKSPPPDPYNQVMMHGPPLFSPVLASAAAR